jgi:hypothetical protein
MFGARGYEQKETPTPVANDSVLPADTPLMDAILQLADWISEVLEEEKAQIAQPERADFNALVARKSHLALELSKLMRVAEGQVPTERVRVKLRQLAVDLAANERLLRRHMDAVYEISSLIGDAIEQSTADGTYSSEIGRRGPKPW